MDVKRGKMPHAKLAKSAKWRKEAKNIRKVEGATTNR